jgi:hypothetical protein
MLQSPKKLLHSKWTAINPQIVTEVTLEAVFSKRHQTLHWRDLSNKTIWKKGWH